MSTFGTPRSAPRGRTRKLAPSIARERRDDVAVLWLDVPDHSLNVLHRDLAADFEKALDALEAELDDGVRAVVIASAKPTGFVAGADIDLLADIESAPAGEALSREAQAVMNRIAEFRVPVVAAIDGACLGGGLEFALACRGRVATETDDTRLGCPEVKLGLIPGAGGTQRLPRLVGLEDALTLILTGRRLAARQALDMGLVDALVHPAIVVDVAAEHARRLVDGSSPERRSTGLRELLTEGNPVGRWAVFRQSKARIQSETHGLMPAPIEAIDVMRTGLQDGIEAGLAAEAAAFGALLQTNEARNLIGLFRGQQALDAEPGADAEPRRVTRVGVIGAGLMGGGIAYVSAAEAGARVRLKDIEREPIREALRSVRDIVDDRVDKALLDARARDRIMGRLTGTTRDDGFGGAEVIIEAVAESLDVKRQVLADVEALTGDDTIFASNTSAIPIQAIAAEATRPHNVVGMHYFSPVHKVPLLEVVRAPMSSPEAIATAVALGKAQGRTVIVVNDGPGFYTSRVLGRYLAEVGLMLTEGITIDAIDRAMVGVGFPVGPFQLMDEVGLDVAAGVSTTLADAFGARMALPDGFAEIFAEREGRKSGRGFYRYEDGARVGVDEDIYRRLGVESPQARDPEDIAPRALAAFAHEAARCYGDGIVRSARDADLGAVLGLGFPAQRGGPLRMIDDMGVARFVEQLEELTRKHGARFEPASVLREAARRGVGLHDPDAPPPGWHRDGDGEAA